MPKGSKGATTTEPDDLLKDLPDTEGAGEGEGGSAAEVAVRGKGRTVADALKKAGLKGPAKDMKGKFNEILRVPTNRITATRVFPSKLRGPDGKLHDCSDVVDIPPPMSLEEITSHLREEYGGKKWNITVSDDEGEVIDRRNIDVPGEPRYVAKPEDDFQIPSLEDFDQGGDGKGEEQDPMDREIEQAEKQSRLLLVERQNASLKAQLAEARGDGNGKHKNGEKTTEQIVAEALAAQEARHKAELAERDNREKMASMETRITDATSRQIGELKGIIEKLQQGNPQQSTALSDLGHKLEILQTSIDTKIDKALGQYREMTNQQINSLEKSVDAKLAAIQTGIAQIQNKPHDPDPLKSIVPLITTSIERSTQGYKEMVVPLLNSMTAKQERESAPESNPLEETLETLGKFNLLGDRKSGDFGARVVDFAEKMGPEIMAFIREEKKAGRDVTENAIKNHLKLQAEKISREVQATAAQEIRKIRAEQQNRPGLPAPAAKPAEPAATKGPQGQQGPSPVGNMSPEEIAARQRQDRPAPAPASTPVSAPAPVASPAMPPRPARTAEPPPVEEPEEEPEEEGEEMTVEEEMAARVNSVLGLLEREMKVRPRQVTWANAAWDDLPGTVLDAVIFSNDEEDVYNAIKPHADPELADRIWELVRTDPKAKDFIVHGVNLIKGWAVELQQKQQQQEQGGGEAPATEGGGA